MRQIRSKKFWATVEDAVGKEQMEIKKREFNKSTSVKTITGMKRVLRKRAPFLIQAAAHNGCVRSELVKAHLNELFDILGDVLRDKPQYVNFVVFPQSAKKVPKSIKHNYWREGAKLSRRFARERKCHMTKTKGFICYCDELYD